jgi:hypothetical protein
MNFVKNMNAWQPVLRPQGNPNNSRYQYCVQTHFLVDGSFHQTAARGFGTYGEDMYMAVPSHDSRIRLPIPGEYVVGGQRVFEKRIKRKTLEIILYELGLYDSEAPIILHGIVSRGLLSSHCKKFHIQLIINITNSITNLFHHLLASS